MWKISTHIRSFSEDKDGLYAYVMLVKVFFNLVFFSPLQVPTVLTWTSWSSNFSYTSTCFIFFSIPYIKDCITYVCSLCQIDKISHFFCYTFNRSSVSCALVYTDIWSPVHVRSYHWHFYYIHFFDDYNKIFLVFYYEIIGWCS